MIPAPLTRLEYLFYRFSLPFRLRRQATIRKARSEAAKRGWQHRKST